VATIYRETDFRVLVLYVGKYRYLTNLSVSLKAAEWMMCFQTLMLFYHHYLHLFVLGISMLSTSLPVIIKPQKCFQCQHFHHNVCKKVTFLFCWATVISSGVGRVGTVVGHKLKPIHIANKRQNIFIIITKHYLIQSLYTANQFILRQEMYQLLTSITKR
jgi:hypothetical protein